MATEREIDEATNTETTGHEWDGIKELDTPMPRWWLWTFYATIIWGVLYTIAYPAWPLVSSATSGLLGYSSRGEFAQDMDAAREAQAPLDERLLGVELASVADDEELLRYATAGGRAVFLSHCSQCHGAGGGGRPGGYPNLLDDAWLWGGSVDQIHQTIQHGIRWDDDPDTHFSQMPAYGEILSEEEIDGLVQYVIGLSGREHDTELAASAAQNFADNCAACHGEEGMGMVCLLYTSPSPRDHG